MCATLGMIPSGAGTAPDWLLFLGVVALLAVAAAIAFITWRYFRPDVVGEFLRFARAQGVGRNSTIDGEWLDLGDDLRVNIHSLQAKARGQSRAARRSLYEKYVSVIREGRETRQGLDLAACRERILPRLATTAMLRAFGETVPLIHRPVYSLHLNLVYVIDSEHSVAYVSEKILRDLKIREEELHTIAMDNLRRRFDPLAVTGVRERRAMVHVAAGDSFDAVRLLVVPELLSEGEEIAACIPDRDTLLLAPVVNDGIWSALTELARRPGGAQRLLDRPVRVTSSGFELR